MNITFEGSLGLCETDREMILSVLPDCFDTVVTTFKDFGDNCFYLEIRIPVFDKDEALLWKSQFEQKSKTYYNLDSTFGENTLKTVFKRVFHCVHNTRPLRNTVNPHIKHTKCRAKLTINIKKPDMKRSKDVYLKDYPCKVSLRYEHNHALDYENTLRTHSQPSKEIEETFVKMFLEGHSISSAIMLFKSNETKLKNCPSAEWCSELYYNTFKDMAIKLRSEAEVKDENLTDDSDLEEKSISENESDNIEYEVTSGKSTSDMNNSNEVNAIVQKFLKTVNVILKKLGQNPDTYVEPVNFFCDVINNAKTHDDIVSALKSSGQYTTNKPVECIKSDLILKSSKRVIRDHPYSK